MKNKWRVITVVLILLIVAVVAIVISNRYDGVTKVEANEAKGFYTEYYLYIPGDIDKDKINVLLVEPNNTGTSSDDHSEHEAEAVNLVDYGVSRKMADELGIPLLVPVFDRPRSNWQLYTHSLDRDSLMNVEGYLQRVDLQLMAMIEDATVRLEEHGVTIADEVFLHGFSASGSFVNRFTALHPERVKAVVAGGVNCMPILPIDVLDDQKLIYPIGIGDVEALTDVAFDLEAYAQVPQYIYMGSLDDNDTMPYDDAFSEEERSLILEVLGENMHDRWNKSVVIYEEKGINAELVMYEGIGHTMNDEVKKDMKEFFRENLD